MKELLRIINGQIRLYKTKRQPDYEIRLKELQLVKKQIQLLSKQL